MTALNAAQQALAAHLAAHVDKCSPLAAVVPAAPVAWAGYVWPATDWISPAEDGTFCASRSVGLVFDLVAGTTDLAESQRWLNDRVDEVWAAGPVDVGDDDTAPERVLRPILIRPPGGVELLVARVEFTRFTVED